MKKSNKMKICAILGAIALSYSIVPVNSSAIMALAAADPGAIPAGTTGSDYTEPGEGTVSPGNPSVDATDGNFPASNTSPGMAGGVPDSENGIPGGSTAGSETPSDAPAPSANPEIPVSTQVPGGIPVTSASPEMPVTTQVPGGILAPSAGPEMPMVTQVPGGIPATSASPEAPMTTQVPGGILAPSTSPEAPASSGVPGGILAPSTSPEAPASSGVPGGILAPSASPEAPVTPQIPGGIPFPSVSPGATGEAAPGSTASPDSQEQPGLKIDYEKVEKEEKYYAHIIVTDLNENPSGIKECQIVVDGVPYISEGMPPVMRTLPNGISIAIWQEYEILLEGDAVHEIQVLAVDNADHISSEFISMQAESEVFEVVLPANFHITIWAYDFPGKQIYSDDVVICNQSDFPIDVSIADVSVMVNHSLPADYEGEEDVVKDCDVGLLLRCMDREPASYFLSEGSNENVATFSLSAKQEGTDSQLLLQMQPVETVSSPDFAVFSLFGSVSEGAEETWRDGDLTVKVTFAFHKQP